MAIDLLEAAAIFSAATSGALITAALTGRRNSELSYRVACLRGTLAKVLSGLECNEPRWSLRRTVEQALELTEEDECVGDFTVAPQIPVHMVGDRND